MRRIDRSAHSLANDADAAMLRARVPSGSLSHLSGNRFAAPVICVMSAVIKMRASRRSEKRTMYHDLRSSHPRACPLVAPLIIEGSVMYYLTSSIVFATSDSEPRSTFKIVGGLARENPVPTAFQSSRSNAFTTCLPSKPVAPVMSAVFAIVCKYVFGN